MRDQRNHLCCPPHDRSVCEGDREQPVADWVLPVVLVLDRLRSAFNVGNVYRLAEATRTARIVTCGYTATPPHPKLVKTARGCEVRVATDHAASAREAVEALRASGHAVYAVETVAGATPVWNATFVFPCAFVLGNEALGVSAEALAACDEVIQLPSFGIKNSINVGNCAAVMLYAALQQWLEKDLGNNA